MRKLGFVSGQEPFLWLILLEDHETEDTVLSLQSDVMCKKLCSCLTNVLQLQQYFG